MKHALPMFRQTETSECGLVCVAMIAAFYGYKTNPFEMRKRFSASLRGMTLEHLSIAAQQLHLASRAIRVELSEMDRLPVPCILHWNMSHFVVLRKSKNGVLTIHDPAFGVRRVRREEANRSFTGIVLELWPTEKFSSGDESKPVTIRELLGRVAGIRSLLARSFALAAIMEVFALCSPLLFQRVIDHIIMKQDGHLSDLALRIRIP